MVFTGPREGGKKSGDRILNARPTVFGRISRARGANGLSKATGVDLARIPPFRDEQMAWTPDVRPPQSALGVWICPVQVLGDARVGPPAAV